MNFKVTAPILAVLAITTHFLQAQAPASSPSPTPPGPMPTPITDQLPTPPPTPTPTETPIEVPTPTPPSQLQEAMETDNDVTTVANGYVTTFHGGNHYPPRHRPGDPGPDSSTSQNEAAIPGTAAPSVSVLTASGDPVPLSGSVLFVDKAGNSVNPTTVPPGTRMQAIEIVDQVDLGPVVHKIMVDQ